MNKKQMNKTILSSILPLVLLLLVTISSCDIMNLNILSIESYSPSQSIVTNYSGIEISVRFSAAMNRSQTERSFTLSGNGEEVPGRFNWADDQEMIFNPLGSLNSSSNYTIEVSVDAEDLYGNSLQQTFNHRFGPNLETDRPLVNSITPADFSTITNLRPDIIIDFSEAMDINSFFSGFSIEPSVDGIYTWNGGQTQFTFSPRENLSWQSTYTISLETSLKDQQGNTLAEKFESRFTVGTDTVVPVLNTVTDNQGPSITLTANDPQSASLTINQNWNRNYGFTLNFSEPIDTFSLTSYLKFNPPVSYELADQTNQYQQNVDLNLLENLDYNTTYFLEVLDGIEDQQQNKALGSQYYFTVNGTESRPPTIQTAYLARTGFGGGTTASNLFQLQEGLSLVDLSDFNTVNNTLIDFYVDVANPSSLDEQSLYNFMDNFSLSVTNSTLSYSVIGGAIITTDTAPGAASGDDTAPAVTAASVGANSIYRLYLQITNNSSNAGNITFLVSKNFDDGSGNISENDFQITIIDQ